MYTYTDMHMCSHLHKHIYTYIHTYMTRGLGSSPLLEYRSPLMREFANFAEIRGAVLSGAAAARACCSASSRRPGRWRASRAWGTGLLLSKGFVALREAG